MGKGDKKTKRGKIVNRSYGVRRPKKKSKGYIPQPKIEVASKEANEIEDKPVAKKAPAKKTTAKKTTAKKAPAKKTTAKKTPAKKAEQTSK